MITIQSPERIFRLNKKADEFATIVDAHLGADVDVAGGQRAHLGVASLDLSLDHCRGIHILMRAGVYGTAFGILRMQLEALCCGIYLARFAKAEEIQRFVEGLWQPKLDTVLKKICKSEEYRAYRTVGKMLDSMHEHTHVGRIGISRRFGADEIGAFYDDDVKAEVIGQTLVFGALALDELAKLFNSPKLAIDANTFHRGLWAEMTLLGMLHLEDEE